MGASRGDGRAPEAACMAGRGAAAFVTPCLLLAATVSSGLAQLGVTATGGLTFTVVIFLLLDFLAYRLERKVPQLQTLRRPLPLSEDDTSLLEAITPAAHESPEEPQATQTQPSPVGVASAVASSVDKPPRAAVAAAAPAAVVTPPAVAVDTTKGLRLNMGGRDMYANAEAPVEFENEFFKGRMLFLLQTNPPDPKWAAHFDGVNRMFEMQIQGKLKLLPKGEVYMGAELEERPKQGLVTQTVSKIVMSFAKQMIRSLHYSFGERRPPADPFEAEMPHITFPLYRVMDWFVVTPAAETPPELGGQLLEEPEDERAERRSGKSPDVVWRTDVTYTMCFHSNTVNFQDWTVINVPGQGSLDLNTFLCKQPVAVVVYDFTANGNSTAHKARDKSYMFQCTLRNDSPGFVARPPRTAGNASDGARSAVAHGMDNREGIVMDDGGEDSDGDGGLPGDRFAVGSSEDDTDLDGLSSTDGRRSGATVIAESRQDASRKAFWKSGDVLPLLMAVDDALRQSSPLKKPGFEEAASVMYLTEGYGSSAIMRRGNAMPSGVQVVKVGGAAASFMSDYLYEGDVVVLLHPESRKFVRIGRSWALGWSSKASSSKINFVIKGIEPGHPLAHCQAFSLSSRKWPDWHVGVAIQQSSKLGGKALGCINHGKRRNTTRYSLLAMVAKPWFDPAADDEGGGVGGVIPALEAESDAVTIKARGPFEDIVSGDDDDDDDDDDDGSDAGRNNNEDSDVEDGLSDSDPEFHSDVESTAEGLRAKRRTIQPQPSFSAAGVGIAIKASRAMACYPDKVSFLRVGVPAWVEFLHRGRRQGQLAFVVSVNAVPLDSTPHLSSAASAAGDDVPTIPNTTAAYADTNDDRSSTPQSLAGATDGDSSPTKAGDGSIVSPPVPTPTGDSRSAAPLGLPPLADPAVAATMWTCLRTGRELSGVVQSFRESVEAHVKHGGQWQGMARPRVLRHMGTADQSVRLMSHELAEIQRWEATFRTHRGKDETQISKKGMPSRSATVSMPHLPAAAQRGRDPNSSRADPRGEARDPLSVGSASTGGAGGGSTAGDLVARSVSPKRRTIGGGQRSGDLDLTSPAPLQPSPCSSFPPPAAKGLEGLRSESEPIDHRSSRVEFSDCSLRGGEGLTAPYRQLCKVVTTPSELDYHFLSGTSAADLDVTVGASATPPLLESAVARCLWESHWREEWAVMFPSHVACYPPLSKRPAWVLTLKALHKASAVSDERCPFPGLRCLRLETIGRVHYLCFVSRDTRDKWLQELVRLSKGGGVVDPPSGLELGQDPREAYVLKTTQWRQPPRFVLNARRPGFDLPEGGFLKHGRGVDDSGSTTGGASSEAKQQRQLQHEHPWSLSAEVLRSAYKVQADSGNKRLVPFLDLASSFRRVDLSKLDLNSDEALCFFANLYHLMVRHMLLVLGPPSSAKHFLKQDWPSSFVQVSYEVGGDVFSLQELEHCVLRGRLPRPNWKDLPKRFAPLPPEGDDHYMYTLGKADGRMSLFLNNASQSNPPVVCLLTPGAMEEQLNRACQAFVDHTVKVDVKKRQIRVHKAFQLYARDLQPRATSKDFIGYGLRFASPLVFQDLAMLDVDYSQASIRYHPYLLKCHETMLLLDLPPSTEIQPTAESTERHNT